MSEIRRTGSEDQVRGYDDSAPLCCDCDEPAAERGDGARWYCGPCWRYYQQHDPADQIADEDYEIWKEDRCASE